ncbi:uracil-xanthine permease family protein [Eubacterium ventriosum]|uniref:uracil-xanthine permease family protein n=1 Tax=Eubacterium ventriosum TaxID=39496 RepID=UPI00267311FF|nr:uracil-xanthine permease family protein [Eubacterium ventriosum]
MSNNEIGNSAVYDARELGKGKMFLLGFQHMFAMFGATVLVPLLTGLDVQTTLLMAGLGTILFHIFTKLQVPAFLGSSFAFLGGYTTVSGAFGDFGVKDSAHMLPYACLGVACAGLLYLVLALLIKLVGVKKVMKFFPPVVTGPIIIAIGLCLAPSALNNCATCWPLAVVALVIVILFNIWGRGMAKIIPILLGVVGAYLFALIFGNGLGLLGEAGQVDVKAIADAAWIGLPVYMDETIFSIDWNNSSAIIFAITTMVPIAIATMMEHIGDICAIGATVGKDFINRPGLHRTLLGDGLATTLSSIFGGPANTTYGENTGVLALSRVYDPRVVRIAAYLAMLFSFSPKFAMIIQAMPSGIVGGISFMLYGMIAAIGVRNVVEAQVDFKKSRNVIVAAIIVVCALGIKFSSGMGADVLSGVDGAVSFSIGGVVISLSGLAVASIAGIILNAVFPDKDEVNDVTESK